MRSCHRLAGSLFLIAALAGVGCAGHGDEPASELAADAGSDVEEAAALPRTVAIAVIGSSTAAAFGLSDPDDGWVARYAALLETERFDRVKTTIERDGRADTQRSFERHRLEQEPREPMHEPSCTFRRRDLHRLGLALLLRSRFMVPAVRQRRHQRGGVLGTVRIHHFQHADALFADVRRELREDDGQLIQRLRYVARVRGNLAKYAADREHPSTSKAFELLRTLERKA